MGSMTYDLAPGEVGMIVFTMFVDDQCLDLAAFGFRDRADLEAHWADLPAADGDTDFIADRYDGPHDISDDKPLTAETIERLTGRTIAEMRADAEAALRKVLDDWNIRRAALTPTP